MKLQSLRILVAVADCGSFSGAALELDLSQSTVSHAIADLEEELSVRLLERGRFGAVATEVGERIVAQARRLESSVDAIVQEAAAARGKLRGTLRMLAYRSVATHTLPPILAELRSRHPGLRILLEEVPSRYGSVADDLLASKAHLALTMPSLAEEVIFWELFYDPYVAVVPVNFQLPGNSVSLNDLVKQPLILGTGPCSGPVRERLLSLYPSFRPAFEIGEDSTILAFAAQGLGIAIMPKLTVDAVPAGTKLLEIQERVERRIGIALLAGMLKVPAVRAFLGAVRKFYPQGEVPWLPDSFSEERVVAESNA